MKNYQVIQTTDNQFLGLVIKSDTAYMDNTDLKITESVIFHIQKTEKINDKTYKHSNAHYIAIVEEID
jgi:hypothetical protein